MMCDGIEMVNLKKKPTATKLACAPKNQELKVGPQFLPEASEQFCLQPDLWLEQFSKRASSPTHTQRSPASQTYYSYTEPKTKATRT